MSHRAAVTDCTRPSWSRYLLLRDVDDRRCYAAFTLNRTNHGDLSVKMHLYAEATSYTTKGGDHFCNWTKRPNYGSVRVGRTLAHARRGRENCYRLHGGVRGLVSGDANRNLHFVLRNWGSLRQRCRGNTLISGWSSAKCAGEKNWCG
jgi:hypothetical protein